MASFPAMSWAVLLTLALGAWSDGAATVHVAGAGTPRVNGVYSSSTPNAGHTWVDQSKGYYMLTAATDGGQAGLVDLYWRRNGGWMISMEGHEQYSSQELFGSWSVYNQGTAPAPSVTAGTTSTLAVATFSPSGAFKVGLPLVAVSCAL